MNDNNGNHEETKLLNSNDEKPCICAVTAWLKICQRIIRLQWANLVTTLLPIYYNFSTSSITNITYALVTGITRNWQANYMICMTKNELRLIACHLLRIGACWKGQQALAFTRRDIIFFSKNKKQLSYTQDFSNPASVQQVKMRHEWQKMATTEKLKY